MVIKTHVTVAANSLPYYLYLVKNYRELSSGKNELQFIAHSLDTETTVALKKHPETHQVFEVYRNPKNFVLQTWRDAVRWGMAKAGFVPPMAGSNGHSAGLSSALAATGEGIDIIADSDTVILEKNWDELVVSLLEKYGIVGTCYEDIGGFSSGQGKVQTYKQKPSLTWFALSSRFSWREFDPRPAKNKNFPIDSKEMSDLYNLPMGFELVRDVGWKIPSYLAENKIPYAVFDQVKPTSKESLALKTGIDYHEEYHFAGKPILAHQRGSHKHPFRGNDISRSFYDSCDRYVAKL